MIDNKNQTAIKDPISNQKYLLFQMFCLSPDIKPQQKRK